LTNCLLAFVPLFVAMDALGLLPLFMGLTDGMERGQRRKVVAQSLVTALVIAVGFVVLGKTIFSLMNIEPADFKVAGGVLLFIIATIDVVSTHKITREVSTIGAVPLGTPLIAGPAVLTTCLILVDAYGPWATLASIVVNIVLTGVVLMSADALTRVLREPGSKALSKVASLILAAIAVMMIRTGLQTLLATTGTHAGR
jgi:multiple antibiotic resistance protein